MRTAAFHFHRMTIPMFPALHQTIIQNMLMLCGANRYMEKFLISQHSWRKLTGNHYKWIFDPGANINVICNDESIRNIRTIEKQSANGIGGPATFTEVGDHPLFG